MIDHNTIFFKILGHDNDNDNDQTETWEKYLIILYRTTLVAAEETPGSWSSGGVGMTGIGRRGFPFMVISVSVGTSSVDVVEGARIGSRDVCPFDQDVSDDGL